MEKKLVLGEEILVGKDCVRIKEDELKGMCIEYYKKCFNEDIDSEDIEIEIEDGNSSDMSININGDDFKDELMKVLFGKSDIDIFYNVYGSMGEMEFVLIGELI